MAAAKYSDAPRRNSGNQLLEELEQLSQTLYQTHTSTTTRRTASLVLPRTSVPPADQLSKLDTTTSTSKPRSRRMSLSPWRSRPKLDQDHDENSTELTDKQSTTSNTSGTDDKFQDSPKKGIWSWKPIRALTHIGMQKLSCLFSVDVVTAQGLPPSMNGLRLSVCVRKKETKDGAVHTMPSRVTQGAADFEETLFLRCHVYCNSGNVKHLKFEPRPFLIYLFAVDAKELEFGRNSVDLSQLIQESVDKSLEGTQLRQWDFTFNLSGKAKGGELVLTFRFQIMENDGGIGIYRQAEAIKSGQNKNLSSAFARKQSKTSFSIPSPRLSARAGPRTPSKMAAAAAPDHLQGIDDLNLDEPGPSQPSVTAPQKLDDLDPPDFEIVDKGVEISEKEIGDEDQSKGTAEDRSTSSEVVKEVLLDQLHMTRLTELDSIAQQIKALESMMVERKALKNENTESQRLDAEEENVTREFLQMLEDEEITEFQLDQHYPPQIQPQESSESAESETKAYLSDLGKGIGCVVQTRDGGYLAAMNPLDAVVARKDTPKLAMQISKPMVLPSNNSVTGFDLFQRIVVVGIEALSSQISSHMPLEELMGKTAEQIAFEGIASAIIQGRNKEGASSTAARTVAVVKTMGTAMNASRKERISTGIWNVNENPLTADEILAFSLQKIEAIAIEALKIQAEMAEEAPFEVSSQNGKAVKDAGNGNGQPLTSAVPLEDWIKSYSSTSSEGELGELGDPETLTLVVLLQLRDPLRRYEAVGGPVLALIHATHVDDKAEKYDGEKRYKVTSLHAGGLKVRAAGKMNAPDTERQRLTAMQWLVAYGLGKGGRKGKQVLQKGQDVFWSMSSRVMADMWLKPMRNPDIKFAT